MKKFVALMFCLFCVGMIFVGCSKGSETYWSDPYDIWNNKIDADENAEYYDETKNIAYSIEDTTADEFSELKTYQDIFTSIKKDVRQLSYEFVHDPKLEGKTLKNAQSKVEEFKKQIDAYEGEIIDFKTAKNNLETACLNTGDVGVGVIEKDEYKAFLASYRKLFASLNNVFSKMYDAAKVIYFPNKNSGFKSNQERINAVKENVFESKILLTQDYLYFCHEHKQKEAHSLVHIPRYYEQVRALELKYSNMQKSQNEANLAQIDAKIESLGIWIDYYKTESTKIKGEMEAGRFKFRGSTLKADGVDEAIIKENTNRYSILVETLMKNLSKTCVDLVAFY